MTNAPVSNPPLDEQRWQALQQHIPSGDFFYAVTTTGIYCRPGCASRLPKRANVRFFDTPGQAEAAGFRPCKRCQPHLPQNETAQHRAVVAACRRLDEAEQPVSLAELAQQAALSPFHFQRLFKRLVGLSPKQYYLQKRQQRLRAALQEEDSVTDALVRAGCSSNSRFYQDAAALGMKPAEYRRGAAGIAIRYALAQCYLGWAVIAATPRGLCAVYFGDHPAALEEELKKHFPQAHLETGDPQFAGWVQSVLDYLEAPGAGINLPLDIQGTAFQRRVWEALRQIPPGATASYSEVARHIGSPGAVRAVGSACAANHLAVIIPCHRVLHSGGGLSGYRWGVERKRRLLEREQQTAGGN